MTTENTENLPTVKEVTIPEIVGDSIFTDTARFVLAQRVANALASSSIVPESFRGNIGNCMIALNMAGRMELDVFMLMSSMYIVHGKPGLEGKLIIALINKSGLFRGPLRFEFKGEGDIRKCQQLQTGIFTRMNLYAKEHGLHGQWLWLKDGTKGLIQNGTPCRILCFSIAQLLSSQIFIARRLKSACNLRKN